MRRISTEVDFLNCIDWDNFYKKGNYLDESLIEHWIDYLDMDLICKNQKLSEYFIKKNINKLDLKSIISTQKLSLDTIEQIATFFKCGIEITDSESESDKLLEFWNGVCIYQELPESFIKNHENDVNWNMISRFQHITSKSFMDSYVEKIDWKVVKNNFTIPESFFIEHYEKFDNNVFRYQNFDNAFIKELPKDVFNYFFNVYAEDDNAETMSYLHFHSWEYLLVYQNMDCDFFEKYWGYINTRTDFLYLLVRYNPLTEEFMERHWDELRSILIFPDYQRYSKEFYLKHENDIRGKNAVGWNSFNDAKIPPEYDIIYL